MEQRDFSNSENVQKFIDEINIAYSNLRKAEKDFAEISLQYEMAKTELEAKRLDGLATGLITGSNADKREAAARAILSSEYSKVKRFKEKSALAKMKLDDARIEVERVRAIVRVYEIATTYYTEAI